MPRTMLVTGGAGFIGSTLAIEFRRRSPEHRVVAFDDLRRRGAELNVARLRDAGVEFRHGDVRADGDVAQFKDDLEQPVEGASARGIAEIFPLDGARTLYGATKLASELLIAEYVDMFGLEAIVNRCGVVSGPWQMGRAEQGVFAHWMVAHALCRPLAYIGFGGHGHQVRDVLHVADLADLIDTQLRERRELRGEVFNVGGGIANSVSLAEFTEHCTALTGNRLDVGSRAETRPGDVPIYVTDNAKVEARFHWTPRRSVDTIARDLFDWVSAHSDALRATLF